MYKRQLLSVINVLMQLRKCCNHPNLFEPRPSVSLLVVDPILPHTQPALVQRCVTYRPLRDIHLPSQPLLLAHHEAMSGFTSYRCFQLCCPDKTMLHPRPARPG